MEFLKRHYEKLILLILLLAFIVSMAYILDIISQTKEITKDKLMIPESEPDYKSEDVANPKYDVAKVWLATQLDWKKSVSREKGTDFSDLVYMFALARCPHCQKIIPRSYFSDKKCPLCENAQVLPVPPERKTELFEAQAGDKDGDGIPDAEEKKYGLNPDDPYDGRSDFDGDGFSNLFEYEQKTSPIDPRNHPPMWYRFYLKHLSKIKLPVKFMALNTNKSEEPSKWDLQINNTNTDKSQFHALNDILMLDKKEYKIVRIVKNQTAIPSQKPGETAQIKDESLIYLEQVGGKDRLTMQVGKEVFSSSVKAILVDLRYPKKDQYFDVGETFNAGTRATKVEKYRIQEIDEKNMTVLLADAQKLSGDATVDEKGEKMLVTKEGKIPEDRRVREGEEDKQLQQVKKPAVKKRPVRRVRRRR